MRATKQNKTVTLPMKLLHQTVILIQNSILHLESEWLSTVENIRLWFPYFSYI
jgi:hypothetical protein